jgi:hypothetical protein
MIVRILSAAFHWRQSNCALPRLTLLSGSQFLNGCFEEKKDKLKMVGFYWLFRWPANHDGNPVEEKPVCWHAYHSSHSEDTNQRL